MSEYHGIMLTKNNTHAALSQRMGSPRYLPRLNGKTVMYVYEYTSRCYALLVAALLKPKRNHHIGGRGGEGIAAY